MKRNKNTTSVFKRVLTVSHDVIGRYHLVTKIEETEFHIMVVPFFEFPRPLFALEKRTVGIVRTNDHFFLKSRDNS